MSIAQGIVYVTIVSTTNVTLGGWIRPATLSKRLVIGSPAAQHRGHCVIAIVATGRELIRLVFFLAGQVNPHGPRPHPRRGVFDDNDVLKCSCVNAFEPFNDVQVLT